MGADGAEPSGWFGRRIALSRHGGRDPPVGCHAVRIVEYDEWPEIRGEGQPPHLRPVIPRHVGCIMDGNGRWALMRGESRSNGHAAAEESVVALVDAALEIGIEWLTVYAFSTENWARDEGEIGFLMDLDQWLLRESRRDDFNRKGVRFRVAGDLEDPRVPPHTRDYLRETLAMTEHNDQLTFCMAFNYGGRRELLQGIRRLASQGLPLADLDDRELSNRFELCLGDPQMPEMDLLIRTSSEYRTSGFFPWHAAYAEFVFADTLWPDFREGHLYSAVREFQTRKRRLGRASAGG